jgi:hypothetical protein
MLDQVLSFWLQTEALGKQLDEQAFSGTRRARVSRQAGVARPRRAAPQQIQKLLAGMHSLRRQTELEHYSREPRDVIDPQVMGNGQAGEETRRFGKDKIPVSNLHQRGATPEARFHGNLKHDARQALALYDARADPAGFRDAAHPNTKTIRWGSDARNEFERLVKEAGYDGIRWPREGGAVITTCYPVKACADLEQGLKADTKRPKPAVEDPADAKPIASLERWNALYARAREDVGNIAAAVMQTVGSECRTWSRAMARRFPDLTGEEKIKAYLKGIEQMKKLVAARKGKVSSVRDLRALTRKGEVIKHWYEHGEVIEKYVGRQNLPLSLAFADITSRNTKMSGNTTLALKALHQHLRGEQGVNFQKSASSDVATPIPR